MENSQEIKNFILDVDGVLSTGQFQYTVDGKVSKIFGPDDNDALGLIKDKLTIQFVSGDKRGFPITKKRVAEDMKFPLEMVSTYDRARWIAEHFDLNKTIYMGDGIYDSLVFAEVAYSIAPANAFYKTRELANYVTNAKGGEGAVAEACFHIMEKFFQPIDIRHLDLTQGTGAWEQKK